MKHPLGTGSSPETTTVFNSEGMPAQSSDALGHTTIYSYDGTGAFLSGIQYPPTPAVHNESFSFDKNTGQMLSHTDQNSNKTVYSYAGTSGEDPLNRLRSVTLPATVDSTTGATTSGSTTYSYDDTPGQLSLTQTTLLGGATSKTNVTLYEIGRAHV